jgi:adenosylcobinamide amidohydrolase
MATVILRGVNVAVFVQFKINSENFIAEAVRLINEQKATAIYRTTNLRPCGRQVRPKHLHDWIN